MLKMSLFNTLTYLHKAMEQIIVLLKLDAHLTYLILHKRSE